MASIVETLKVYVIGVEFPASLNDPSLVKLISLLGEWRTKDAPQLRRSIARMHRRIGVVLDYDPVTSIAVIFLGSSRPTQPQRYLPWMGTPRLPFQTRQVLQPNGEEEANFRNFSGYLNFTHAVRVLVVQPGSVKIVTNFGSATINDILDRDVNPQNAMHIRVPHCQIEMLKDLHASYWNGLHYSFDGEELGRDGGRCGAGGASVSVEGSDVSAQEDHVAQMSLKLGRALVWEHFRNQQISMVKGDRDKDENTLDLDNLPRCVLGPLIEKDLQSEFFSYESSIGFPWETNLGRDNSVQVGS